MRVAWVSFDVIGRHCLAAAAVRVPTYGPTSSVEGPPAVTSWFVRSVEGPRT